MTNAEFAARMKTCRILVNTPSSHGGIGDLYNFKLAPSLTLGCGSWGGNSVSENVGVKHLINIKTVAERRQNMLWFRAPQKVYLKKGCLPVALLLVCPAGGAAGTGHRYLGEEEHAVDGLYIFVHGVSFWTKINRPGGYL